jgi:hypothetical protein
MPPGSGSSASDDGHSAPVGLGFAMPSNVKTEVSSIFFFFLAAITEIRAPVQKSRPSQLTLSPSDGNLKGVIDITREEEEKAVMSDVCVIPSRRY